MTTRRPADHVVLVGMMGSGKSSIAPILADQLGRPAVDLDELVERRCGVAVPALFERLGEEGFRAEEAKVLEEALVAATPCVLAAGGGVVVDGANRALLAASAQVVWLRARPGTLAGRVGKGAGRPLLRGESPLAALTRLAEDRADAYQAAADVVVDVDEGTPESLAAEVARRLVRRVCLELGERRHDVVVGPGARHELASLVPAAARRAVVVSQAGIDVDLEAGVPTERIDIGPGERAKTFATVEQLCRRFVAAGLTRSDVVIGLGGGVVTDVAGFAAACYHRGIPVVHVATTLLAQVDAAVGGKTGVNLPEGKNLAGAFWQPAGVICDTDTLGTLPEREWRSGLGEMAKYAFLGVDGLGQRCLSVQVARCVAAKAAVVGADEREGGARMLLNYGHTLAHALEAARLASEDAEDGGVLRHGEAVALGILFAARLARELGRIDDARVGHHAEVVRAYGLPETLPDGMDPDHLVALMGRDKKALGGRLTFVLDGPAGPEVVRDVDAGVVRALLEEACAKGRLVEDGTGGAR